MNTSLKVIYELMEINKFAEEHVVTEIDKDYWRRTKIYLDMANNVADKWRREVNLKYHKHILIRKKEEPPKNRKVYK